MSYPRTNTRTAVDSQTAAPAVTTLAKIGDANNARRWRVRKVLVSYRGTPTQNGTVTIAGTAGGVNVSTPTVITHSFVGQATIDFGPEGLQCAPYTDLVVTLSAGAAAVVGDVTTIAFAE